MKAESESMLQTLSDRCYINFKDFLEERPKTPSLLEGIDTPRQIRYVRGPIRLTKTLTGIDLKKDCFSHDQVQSQLTILQPNDKTINVVYQKVLSTQGQTFSSKDHLPVCRCRNSCSWQNYKRTALVFRVLPTLVRVGTYILTTYIHSTLLFFKIQKVFANYCP